MTADNGVWILVAAILVGAFIDRVLLDHFLGD